jgi:uncharacterized membrane protein
MNVIEAIQNFVLGLPDAIQFLGVALAAMVPFVENYGAVMIGSVAGIPIWAVVSMAIVGNVAIIGLITLISGRTRDAVLARRSPAEPQPEVLDNRQQRVRRLFDRYGIPGVTLLGMLFVPTHLIAATLVSFGCSRAGVLTWQAIAITVYAGLTGALMLGLISLGGA